MRDYIIKTDAPSGKLLISKIANEPKFNSK